MTTQKELKIASVFWRCLMGKIKRWILYWMWKKKHYRIEDLQIGGHCGLCGTWIPDEIFPNYWAIGVCDKCMEAQEGEE